MSEISAFFSSLLESVRFAPRLHTMLVHLPVGAVVLGAILLVGMLITRGKSTGIRWCCFTIFLVGAAAALASSYTGEAALEYVPSDAWEDTSIHVAERHELLGQYAWIPLALTASLIAFTAVPTPPARWTALGLAVFLAVVSLGWITVTAHYGGLLVHEHSLIRGPVPKEIVAPLPPDTVDPAPKDTTPPTGDTNRKPGFFGIPTH